ncbi:MAG TPA: AI-2E family transporter [Bacillota bacterium]|nr:AI-2E family transporter [Bacillota bacterium]
MIVVAVLYFAREVFIPLALAVLLAFLLAPSVIRLRHWGWGRVPAALSVVLLAFGILGCIVTFMVAQSSDLARKLPGYEENVHKKLEALRSSGGGIINRVSRSIHDFTEELTPAPSAPPQPRSGEEKPLPVEVRRSNFSPFEVLQKILGSVLSLALTAAIVIVFVIFILIEREDLRDRMFRLAGTNRVNVTTQLLDDAAHRVSRYLLAQLIVNVVFGVLAGIGLYFIGVPNPVLWGVLAALLRYIPYLGIWIAAIMPAALVFAVEPGWLKVPAVFGLYFGIDLMMYNFVEPLLYGSSTGISPLAILVAAVFWTWLWGAVGLLLATPLTVCVVVIGRHVPRLEFLQVLLSDEPVLSAETRFYQRLLAMDVEEATAVAEEFLKGKSLEALYDEVIIPALSLAEEDRHRGRLDEDRQRFIFQNTRMVIEDLAERADALVTGDAAGKQETLNSPDLQSAAPDAAEAFVLCIPARDEADEIAALMLVQLLNRRGVAAKALSSATLAGESLEEVGRGKPRVACVSAVPPFGYMHARYLCRRLHDQFKEVKVVGAILTEHDVSEVKQRQPAIAADELASSLRQVLTQVLSLISVRTTTSSTEPALSSSGAT